MYAWKPIRRSATSIERVISSQNYDENSDSDDDMADLYESDEIAIARYRTSLDMLINHQTRNATIHTGYRKSWKISSNRRRPC